MKSSQVPSQRRWPPQISLAWLVVGVLLLGPILGFGGPLVVDVLQQLSQPPRVPAAIVPSAAFDSTPSDYFESGETPLD